MMASSRIFVRGLPPTLTEADFQKHFATTGSITDTKLFPQRRIGYVGYQSAEEAQKAVKYFNKTFIRMSKLAVELAKPVAEAPTSLRQSHRVLVQPNNQSVATSTTEDDRRNLKRKRGSDTKAVEDPKLREYLDVMQGREKVTGVGQSMDNASDVLAFQNGKSGKESDVSDEEIQTITKKTKKPSSIETAPSRNDAHPEPEIKEAEDPAAANSTSLTEAVEAQPTAIVTSDADWLRSKTKRTLDLHDDKQVAPSATQTDESMVRQASNNDDDSDGVDMHEASTSTNVDNETIPERLSERDITSNKIRESQRLFLRNLAYKTTEDSIRAHFSNYASIAEVHVSIDNKTGQSKGLAYVLFNDAEDAVNAWQELDGTTLNGRLLHILPATAKRETQLDDFTLSKLPLKKQQQIKKRRDAASTTFNWNSLYMNSNAVMSSIADRLGVDKSTLLDPTSSDAAVKQAHAETHVIQEAKSYFESHGVNLDSFTRSKRGDTAILVKNFPYDAKADELKTLFEQHGKVKRFLMPPSGTIAIVEFESVPQAKAAFAALAYRKIKTSVLFLEKAPHDVFSGVTSEARDDTRDGEQSDARKAPQLNATDLLHQDSGPDATPTTTLFVRNLNFSTTTDRLDEVFRPLEGFMSARVKTKSDPKKPGQILSMGFGFLEFRNKEQAQKALSAMDGYKLDGHDLQIRASHKGLDAAEERRQQDLAKKAAIKRAKLVIKNLPFEASKKDLRSLLGAYGQLKSVRLPKKIGQSTRGFAFAEFTTPKEAENAMTALRNTHLLGRRLVIDYAAEDPEDAEEEIEKMQTKMGSQLNKVAVQNLMGDGRKKFSVGEKGDED